jgi:hypothetical protein
MSRFFRRGKTKVYWVPTLSSTTSPSAAQINAGVNMSAQIADISGFEFSNSPIPTPDLSTPFTTTIPGEDTAQEPQLVFYEDDTTNTLQTTLAKGTTGHTVKFYKGTAGASPAAGDRAEVWPVISTGPYREYSMGNDPARWGARFTPTATPVFDALLVA